MAKKNKVIIDYAQSCHPGNNYFKYVMSSLGKRFK
jgi:hypothetical protein